VLLLIPVALNIGVAGGRRVGMDSGVCRARNVHLVSAQRLIGIGGRVDQLRRSPVQTGKVMIAAALDAVLQCLVMRPNDAILESGLLSVLRVLSNPLLFRRSV